MDNVILSPINKESLIEEITAKLSKDILNGIRLILKESKNPPKEELTTKETAELLGCSIPTVRNWTKQNRLQPYKRGQRKVFYLRSEVLLSQTIEY